MSSLRSVVGVRRSGAEGGEARIANRSRSATAPLPSRRRKAAALAAHARLPLVTSARFAQRNGRCREGTGTTRSPWSGANHALVTANQRSSSAFRHAGEVDFVSAFRLGAKCTGGRLGRQVPVGAKLTTIMPGVPSSGVWVAVRFFSGVPHSHLLGVRRPDFLLPSTRSGKLGRGRSASSKPHAF